MKKDFFKRMWGCRKGTGGVDRYVYCSSCKTLHRYKWTPSCEDCADIGKNKKPEFLAREVWLLRCVGCGYTDTLIHVDGGLEVKTLCKNGANLVVTLYDCCRAESEFTWGEDGKV